MHDGGSSPLTRGKLIESRTVTPPCVGSSPLTRGKRRVVMGLPSCSGLIPAHAGKTSTRGSRPVALRAHPRSRGENVPSRCPALMPLGSSPLTRGKRGLAHARAEGRGLIPAHAGKTSSMLSQLQPSRAHPRSRGENTLSSARGMPCLGSSPLTRGKHFLTCAFIAQIDQILESLELCAFSESYSSQDVYATDAPRDRVRSIGLAPRSSRGAS